MDGVVHGMIEYSRMMGYGDMVFSVRMVRYRDNGIWCDDRVIFG